MGLPTIVNFRGWIYELIYKEEIGFFQNLSDISLLIKELDKVESNPVRLQQMGQRARKIAERRFDKKEAQRKLFDLLNSEQHWP